jgi:hypothetical protein
MPAWIVGPKCRGEGTGCPPRLNRSELIERALRHEHLRIALENYTTHTVPALNIDDYANKIYQANRVSGL